MGQQSDWDSLFERAAFDPSEWLGALQHLADRTGSGRAQLVGVGDGVTDFNLLSHTPDGIMADLVSVGGHQVQHNFRCLAEVMFEQQPVVHEAHYDSAKMRIGHSGYDDLCRDYDIPYGCQTVLARGNGRMIGLALLRGYADGMSDDQSRDVFRTAGMAASTAVRLQTAIGQQGQRMMLGLLDSMSVACFLLDRRGRVVGLTPSAEAHLLHPGCAIRVKRGLLSGLFMRGNTQIDGALADILQHEKVRHRRITLDRADHGAGQLNAAPWCFDIFRVRQLEWGLALPPSAVMVLRQTNQGRNAAADAELLQGVFGLTPAEAAVAMALQQGTPRADIALSRRVSGETLRGQIKTIYAKIGCNRESQLVQILSSLLD